jgi:hypothetical protein
VAADSKTRKLLQSRPYLLVQYQGMAFWGCGQTQGQPQSTFALVLVQLAVETLSKVVWFFSKARV